MDKSMSALRRVAARIAPAGVAALAAVALAACGSSKPAYCSSRTNLENSVKGLTNLTASSGVSGLKSQLQKIQSDANTLVSQAKADFPSETSAISSSVKSLESAVKSLSSSPSAGQIATVTSAANGVVSSVNSFTNATKSKCG
jgi:predicted trehalose synthase